MPFFENTADFLAQFGDIETAGYFDPVYLNDTKAGFSIKRNYPENIRYKPAFGQKSKKPDNVATIWAIYTHPDELRKTVNENAVPLRIRISNMSLYTTKYWDYDFDNEESESPSKESFEASKATPMPIELEYSNEYFYNHESNSFIDSKGHEISGVDVLNRVFQDHCDTVHLLKGLRLRTKLFFQDKVSGFLTLIIQTLDWSLKNLFGRTLEDSDMMAGLYRAYKPEAMKKLETDSLNILGYKASKRVIMLYCVVVIIFSYWFYKNGTSETYLSWVASSKYLTLIYAIFTLWVLDVAVPWIVFWSINLIILLKTTVLFMKFKGP
ncbi:MAG: hypothetical protein IIA06_03260 [Proteobacteria bacterium]|nr:hypothetical protein [Pseudomonadota bacterium]MCH8976973.1 hypothetical protein [Pseudomonadota bacterium]